MPIKRFSITTGQSMGESLKYRGPLRLIAMQEQEEAQGQVIERDDGAFEINSAYIRSMGNGEIEVGNAHTVFVGIDADRFREAFEEIQDVGGPDGVDAPLGTTVSIGNGITVSVEEKQPLPFIPPVKATLVTDDDDGIIALRPVHVLDILDRLDL